MGMTDWILWEHEPNAYWMKAKFMFCPINLIFQMQLFFVGSLSRSCVEQIARNCFVSDETAVQNSTC